MMENNKVVVFFGLLILLAVVISTIGEYDITGQIARGGPGNYPGTGPGVGPTNPPETGIGIVSAGCEWTGNTFWVCETVRFSGLSNYYAKGVIPGGEPLSKSPKQEKSPFIYCQTIGDTEGMRVVQAYLYGTGDTYRDVDGDTVLCSKNKVNTENQKVKFNFQTKSFGPRDASGTEYVDLKGKPISCEVNGYYKINDKFSPSRKNYGCSGAIGTLKGHIEEGLQYVYEDSSNFDWKESGSAFIVDPPEKYHEGYAFYATSCDPVNYFKGENYARARATITDKGLQVDWDYSNEDTKPRIDFVVNLDCKVRVEKEEGFMDISKKTESIEEEPKKEGIGVIEPETVIENAPISVWQGIRRWFLSLF